jgi:uncharacterized protein
VSALSLETLCQACGLCCDGSLFTRVPLGFQEVAPEGVLGVVTNPFGARHVPQPCAALAGTCCQVYAQRPRACRGYECFLYIARSDDEVDHGEALNIVRRARALVEAAGDDPGRRAERDAYLSFHFARRR